MKSAILKRDKLGVEVFQVIVQYGDTHKSSQFLSEFAAHNWLREQLRKIPKSES